MTDSEKAKAARNEYKRRWNKANKEKVREYQKRYWAKKSQEAASAMEVAEQDQEALHNDE
mgnify:CR=1 FL=1